MEIKNHTILITGGASGLGAATVRQIVNARGNVAIFDVQQDKGAALAAELGDQVIFCLTDVTREESVNDSLAKAKDQFGAIHGCVNAAGCGWTERTVSKKGAHSFPVFEQIIRLNLLGTFNVASKAAQAMSENAPNEAGERGVIVNVASVAAFDGQIGQVAYAASKGAVVSMALPMARDLAVLGIRVMTVAPGMFQTPLLAMLPPDALNALNASVPFRSESVLPKNLPFLWNTFFAIRI